MMILRGGDDAILTAFRHFADIRGIDQVESINCQSKKELQARTS